MEVVKKRKLFDDEKLRADLNAAIQSCDTILRVKLENRVALNTSTRRNSGVDKKTLDLVVSRLIEFNKDRRSYGINTGIEIAIDIINEMLMEAKND